VFGVGKYLVCVGKYLVSVWCGQVSGECLVWASIW
jgi:hypothetical protein